MPPRSISKSPAHMPNGQLRKTYEIEAREFVGDHYEDLQRYASYIVLYKYPNRDTRIEDITHQVIQWILEGRYNIRFDKAPLTYTQFLLRNAHRRMDKSKRDSPINEALPLEEIVLAPDEPLDDLEQDFLQK